MTRSTSIAIAQLAVNTAQVSLTEAQAQMAAAQALPLDRYTSTAAGLDTVVDESGNVLPHTTVVVFDANGGQWSGLFVTGQSLLNAVGAQPFPQSRGPATMVRDAQGALQFTTDGNELVPVPLLLQVTRYDDIASTSTMTPMEINWTPI